MRVFRLTKQSFKLPLLAALALVVAAAGVLYRQPAPAHGATNGKIVFSRTDADSRIFVMDADGTNMHEIITADPGNYPMWSPDGTKIAYSTLVSGVYQIAVMNADGSGQTQLTHATEFMIGPSWSPDGSKLAFLCYDGVDTQLCTINVDGSNQTQITHSSTIFGLPDWSVANKIAYTCYDGVHTQICTINPDGSGDTQITHDVIDHEWASWSHDGTRLVYQEAGTFYVYRLAIINADGTGLQHLTTTTTNVQTPRWSPDNSKIVYSNFNGSTDATQRIYTIGVDGTGETAISDDDGIYSDLPSWQPLVTSDQDGDGSLSAAEQTAPNGGDANNDGVGDFAQPMVTSMVNGVTSKYVALQSDCVANAGVSAAAATHTDAGFTYPAGLLSFTLDCSVGATATVTQYFYGLSANSTFVLRKYNASTNQYATVPGAVISAVTIGGQAATKVVYQIADGGPLDQDATANGTIVDPVGVALPAAGVPNTGLGGLLR